MLPRDLPHLKAINQEVALHIGGLAGLPTRDQRSNVAAALWVKYLEQSMVGMLLETSDIRKILLEQIQLQLAARKDLIQEMEQNDVVVKWLMAFTNSWEAEYSSQIVSQHDIGQLVLSCMHETFFEVIALLDHSRHFRGKSAHALIADCVRQAEAYFEHEQADWRIKVVRARGLVAGANFNLQRRMKTLGAATTEAERADVYALEKYTYDAIVLGPLAEIHDGEAVLATKLHSGDDAAVRLLFRHPETRSLMCRVAGAILRKQEVCNRSGGYSAKVQRNDITQQKHVALDTFCAWVLDHNKRLQVLMDVLRKPEDLVAWIRDHKQLQEASNGRHFSHDLPGA